MSLFTITHPAQPHLVLFASPALAEIAAALTAQDDADELTITFNRDGFSRDLDDGERAELEAFRRACD